MKRPFLRDGGPRRVLLLENIHPSAVEMFRAEGFEVDALKQRAQGGGAEAERSRDVDVLGIRSKTQIPRRGARRGAARCSRSAASASARTRST